MKVRFTDSAVYDLKRLKRFIERNNPAKAKTVRQTVLKIINQLLEHPQSGRDVEALPGVDEVYRNKYIVRYCVENNELIVLRIWHELEDRE
tara:strand:- start:1018 stop:1290 length:273 start_codon:yes stop_codon:yes gene_type:complete